MELSQLRTIRQRRLLTQDELAHLAGLTTASISRIETGVTKARISTVRRLATALNVEADELFGVNNFAKPRSRKGGNS